MAININGKKTSLDDAAIYQQRDDNMPEKERFRNMSPKQRWTHFSTYDLPKLLIITAIAAIVFYILWVDFIKKADIYMRCAILNESISDSALTELSDRFTETLDMDIGQNKASFYIYYTEPDIAAQFGSDAGKDLSEIGSRLVAGMLDTMIATPAHIEQTYMKNGFITDLSTFLTKEEYSRLQKYLYIPSTDDNQKGAAYGIRIAESSVYQSLFSDRIPLQKDPVFFIMTNATDEGRKYARRFIYFLFPEVFAIS